MRGFRLAGALCALVAPLAALPNPAHAQSSHTPAVWYRASAECPTGLEFLSKISDWEQRARLAEAGDHIDFVVTLLSGSGETVGRLERQTERGTVAIRELRDATCAQVASALALSLGLALDPARSENESPTPEATPASTVTPAPALPNEAALAPAAPSPASQALPAVVAPAPVASSAPRTDAPPPSHLRARPSFGMDAGLLTGLGTQTLLRGTAFVDIARATRQLSLRFALVGALGTSPTPFGSVKRRLLAGRGEVCPWRWGAGRFELSPCAAFELGATSASLDGQSDRSFWAAPGVGLHVTLAVARAFRLEAALGVLLPLVRAHVFHAAEPLYQDEMIVFHAALGVSFGQH